MTLTYNGHSLPTTYNGITFRSRLEARWAVFFDEMKIAYLYEPKTMSTDFGWYIPDFYLPQFETFWIVKGDGITSEEQQKVRWLAEKGYGAVVAIGEIPIDTNNALGYRYGLGERTPLYGWVRHHRRERDPDFDWDTPVFFGQCRYCGRIELTYECRIGRLCVKENDDLLHPHELTKIDPKMFDNCDTNQIDLALQMARRHTFQDFNSPSDAA